MNILICALLFIFSALNVIVNKLYAVNKSVCDSNSYIFMLNFLLIIIIVPVLFIYKIKTKTPFKQIACSLTLKQASYIILRTLTSNCGAIITMIVLTKMDVSLYTMLTTSIALILNTLASRYIFKEKMPFENKIAVLLTVLSICLAV